MKDTVKKTFKPEFINRLSGIVAFNDMTREMANSVLDKKLAVVHSRLRAKNVVIRISKQAHSYLLEKGYSERYGAREMDRAIRNYLNTLLMKEILFGRLKNGGKAVFGMARGASFVLSVGIFAPLKAEGAADPADPDRGSAGSRELCHQCLHSEPRKLPGYC